MRNLIMDMELGATQNTAKPLMYCGDSLLWLTTELGQSDLNAEVTVLPVSRFEFANGLRL